MTLRSPGYLRTGAAWTLRAIVLALITALWVVFTRWWFPPIVEGLESLGWPSTEGSLLSASVMEQYGGGRRGSSGARMSLGYFYETRDDSGQVQPRQGWRFNAAGYRGSFPLFQRGAVMEAMRRPDSLRVFYDPRDPNRSMLRRGIAVETLLLALLWVPLSLLVFLCWRHALAREFWRSMGRAFSTDGTIPWMTRIAVAMAGVGIGGGMILWQLSWAWGRLAPAWALGLLLLAFVVGLILPMKVEAAFAHKGVQVSGVILVVALLLSGVLSGGSLEHMRARMTTNSPVAESYISPLEKLTSAMNSPHHELKVWALDHLRMHPRGEAQTALVRQGLKDAHPQLRWMAIRALATMGPSAQALLPDAFPLLEDADREVRWQALHAAREWVGIDPRVDQDNRILPAPVLTWSSHEVELLTASLSRLREDPDLAIRDQADRLLAHIAAAQRRAQNESR